MSAFPGCVGLAWRCDVMNASRAGRIMEHDDQVIDGEGNVTGLLSIAKCLYDAIHRLKKKAARAGAASESGDSNPNLAASVLQVRIELHLLSSLSTISCVKNM